MTVVTEATRESEAHRLAAKPSEVPLGSGDRGNDLITLRVVETRAEVVSGFRDGIITANCRDRNIGYGIEHRDVQADAVSDIVQAGSRVDPADIEDVEGAAGLAVGIVLGHQHDIDQTDGSFLVRAAGGTVRGTSAIVRDQSRGEDNCESY
jgi:hypothetical protein